MGARCSLQAWQAASRARWQARSQHTTTLALPHQHPQAQMMGLLVMLVLVGAVQELCRQQEVLVLVMAQRVVVLSVPQKEAVAAWDLGVMVAGTGRSRWLHSS